jgi:hypothetical protein
MTPQTQVTFRLIPRAELTRFQTERLFQLLEQHFDGVTREQFARDLAEKNLVLLLERNDQLVGFSTLLAYTTRFDDKLVNVIYSGDTIVAPEAWGTMALPRAWVAGVQKLQSSLPPGRCFWLLLTSGFRTYRFLPVFWREFFPRFDCPTAPDTRRLLNQLARERFGDQFDPTNGIVRFTRPQRLNNGLKEVPPGRIDDPHIQYFLLHNPGYASGDELVCLTEICPQNLTAAGRRMMPLHELESIHS